MAPTETGTRADRANLNTALLTGAPPIRIAQVVGKVVMGGVDRVVMNYYRRIDREKVQFDFYMDGFAETPIDDEIRALGGRVFKLPPYETNLRDNLFMFRNHLRSGTYNVVHSHMNTLSGFWLREAMKAGVPVRIAHSHSTAVRGEGGRALMKYALRPIANLYANEYLACTEHAGQWQFGRRRYSSGTVRLIKNAIETGAFARSNTTRMSVRAELGLEDKYVIGHVGRFEFPKNHRFLVEVLGEVARALPNAAMLFVGDGGLRKDIEALCQRKGLTEKVVFAGVRSDVHRLMQAMDCFVFPSRFEGLGMAVVEAQVAGLPCIVSTEVPNEAAITRGFIPLGLDRPPSLWADRIVDLAASRHLRDEGVSAARASGYCIEKEAPRLTALYVELAGRSTESTP